MSNNEFSVTDPGEFEVGIKQVWVAQDRIVCSFIQADFDFTLTDYDGSRSVDEFSENEFWATMLIAS